MPTQNCPSCGTEVRFEGQARICPSCGYLVTAGAEPPRIAVRPVVPPEPESAPEPEPFSQIIEDEILSAEPVPGTLPTPQPKQVYEPAPASKPIEQPEPEPDDHDSFTIPTAYLMIGGMVLTLVVLLAFVLIMLTHGTPAVVVAPPPPPPPPPVVSAPQPRVVEPAPTPVVPPKPATEPAVSQVPRRSAGPHDYLAYVHPRPPSFPAIALTDEQIGTSITRGVAFLFSQIAQTRLKDADKYDPETFAGLNALALYALLHCGLATNDPNLSDQNEQIRAMLERIKEYPMTGGRATYSRSLRVSALTVLNRRQDRVAIEADIQWLLKASMSGSYTYTMPGENVKYEHGAWDNSNSQYGALGLWAAAEVGHRVPNNFWRDLERHWTSSQVMSGGWGYAPGNATATLAMTAAGVNMLFVSRDRMSAESLSQSNAPLSAAIVRAMEWIEEGNHAVNIVSHTGYTLFGIERAGLASGYKYFGEHNWFEELAAKALTQQKPDGSWEGTDGPIAETAFTLLFLSRGRHPVIINKLKYDGEWSNRPRDVSSLTRFASRQLERPVNWGIAELKHNWWEWLDAPVLLITSKRGPVLNQADIDKLRSYAEGGGLILLNAEDDSPEFNAFAADLSAKMFPDRLLARIPADHPIYSAMFNMTTAPTLSGVNNGSRLLLVHSPTDLTKLWSPTPQPAQRIGSEMGTNVVIYAAGRRELRNRMVSNYVPLSTDSPIARISVARLKYEGNWDPEPGAWPRMARLLQNQTSLGLFVVTTPMHELSYTNAPIAYLTGTAETKFDDGQIDALRRFLDAGGMLIIDACGGSPAFANSVDQQLLPKIAPGQTVGPISPDDELLSNTGEGMASIRQMILRQGTERSSRTLRTVRVKRGQVLVSSVDMTSGILGTTTVGIYGFEPRYAQDLVKNSILLTIQRIRTGMTTNP